MYRLDFSHKLSYASRAEGISLEVRLKSGRQAVSLLAQVDTGASNCLFKREHAELLGLDIEAGQSIFFSSATGRAEAFGHTLSGRI